MKDLICFFMTGFLSMGSVVSLSQERNGSHLFTLEQCIDYALEYNQTLRVADLESESSRVRIQEFLSDGLPQLEGGVDLANNFKVPTSFIPAIFFDPNAGEGDFIPVQFGTQYLGRASVDLTQMIFDGAFFIGMAGARTFSELRERELVRTEIEVIESVTKAYYNLLVAQARYELIEKNYGRLDTLLEETRSIYENGFAEKMDVNRIQVEFNNMAVAKKNERELLKVSNALLKFQMGMPIKQNLTPAEKIEVLEFDLEKLQVEDFNFQRRIEYAILQTQRDLKMIEMKYTKVQYFPTIDFYGSLGANVGSQSAGDLFNTERWFGLGFYGLRMNVPIFDGMRKRSIIQQNRLQLQQIDYQVSRLENNINFEIQDSQTRLFNNIENMRTQKDNMALANEVFITAKAKYQEGLGSNLEVIDAGAAYKEAQINYYDAIFVALISKVDLDKALGLLTDTNF